MSKKIFYLLILSNLYIFSGPLKPGETIIAFDFNKVIVHRDKLATAKLSLMAPFQADGSLMSYYWNNRKKLDTYAVKEQFFEEFFDKNPHLRSSSEYLYLDAAACQTPDKDMVKLVYKLKQNGYTPTIFSNMGSKIYNNLKNKNKSIKAILSNFDALEIVTCKEDGYMHKPQPAFYHKYISAAKAIKPGIKNIIFVDDKKANVDAFAKVCADLKINYYGFVFKGSEASAKSLKKYLNNLLSITLS